LSQDLFSVNSQIRNILHHYSSPFHLSPYVRLFTNQLVFYAEDEFCALIRLLLVGCPNGPQSYELFSCCLYLKYRTLIKCQQMYKSYNRDCVCF